MENLVTEGFKASRPRPHGSGCFRQAVLLAS
ncbi:unnamed protein product [Brucella canis str. Oliveri]|nr:unnamed protein product [Brucella canis str. Oliveri]